MYCYKSTGTQIKGTVLSSGTNVVTLDTAATDTDDLYNGWTLIITAGTGIGQIRVITDYTEARLTTVNEDWTIPPNGTSEYILNEAQFIVDDVNGTKNLVVPSSTTDPVTAYVPTGSLRFNKTGDELEVGKNDNTWSAIGGGGLSYPLGYVNGMVPIFISTTGLNITEGICECNGKIFTLSGAHAALSIPTNTGGDNYVINIFIDDTSSISAPTFLAESWAQNNAANKIVKYDIAKNGYYKTTDNGATFENNRFIGFVIRDGGFTGTTIESFLSNNDGNSIDYVATVSGNITSSIGNFSTYEDTLMMKYLPETATNIDIAINFTTSSASSWNIRPKYMNSTDISGVDPQAWTYKSFIYPVGNFNFPISLKLGNRTIPSEKRRILEYFKASGTFSVFWRHFHGCTYQR
jgi:hypothetical protein